MKTNKTVKRVLSGLLAVMMCATTIPTVSFAADDVTETTENTDNETSYADILAYLSIVEDSYSLPYYMISEGDSVYINGEKVATTTVEVDRNLAFSEEVKKYWLDATAFGSYEALEEAANRLNTYIDSTRTGVNTAETNLKNLLCEIRDYCLATNLTAHNTDAYNKLADAKVRAPMDIQVVRPESTTTASEGTTAFTETPTYTDLKTLQGTSTKEEYDYVEKLMGARLNIGYPSYIAVSDALEGFDMSKYGLTLDMTKSVYAPGSYVTAYVNELIAEAATQEETFAAALDELFGDSSTSSADWLAESLETQSAEDIAYSCAVISSNLKLLHTYETYLTEYVYTFYDVKGNAIAKMTLPEYFGFLAAYDYVTPVSTTDTQYMEVQQNMYDAFHDTYYNNVTRKYSIKETDVDSTKVETNRAYTDANTVISTLSDIKFSNSNKLFTDLDAYTSKLCTLKYADYVDTATNVYTYNTNKYERQTNNVVDVTMEPSGLLKARNDARDKAILNMPDDCITAWYTLYDTSMGYDAFTVPADPTVFKSTFDERQAVVDGAWDFGASKYDAVKYITEHTEVEGTPAETKKALTDADGNLKHYGKQNEVTPWINWQYLTQNAPENLDDLDERSETDADARVYNAYVTWATHETYRNISDDTVAASWKNPRHPEKYTVSNSPDMTAMLKEKGYAVDGSEEFVCTGMRLNVSRFAMDGYGTDAQNIYYCTVDFSKDPNMRYDSDVANWLEQIYVSAASEVSETMVDSFMAYVQSINPLLSADAYNYYREAYIRYRTGFNIHNGFVFTIDYIYECDGLEPEPDNALAQLNGVNKILLTEIPEYSISEYYEDKSNLLKLSDVRSAVFNTDDTTYKDMYKLFEQNPEKLFNRDTKDYTFAATTPSSWTKQLERYAINRSLGYAGTRFTVPTGVSVTVPAYIPVSGRTIDTRYYVRYLPCSPTASTPTPNNSAYYAVDMTDTIGAGSESFASVTANGAPTFCTLNVADDKTPYYTVFYALDRGVNTVAALQRVMTPINPFVVTGSTPQNLNNSLTVGDNTATENGYQDATFGTAVAEQGLPTLVWNTLTGNIVNQDTDNTTYGGDVHVWVSKSSEKDGIIAADWVNSVPEVLKDAINATNTTTGIYDPTATNVSVERPSTATAGKPIKIKSGITTGTFADWAFKRTLTKASMPYCMSCKKFIADTEHHRCLQYSVCVSAEESLLNKMLGDNARNPAGGYGGNSIYDDYNNSYTTGTGRSTKGTYSTSVPANSNTPLGYTSGSVIAGNGNMLVYNTTTDPTTGKPLPVSIGSAATKKDFSDKIFTLVDGKPRNGAWLQQNTDGNNIVPLADGSFAMGGFQWGSGTAKKIAAIKDAIKGGANLQVGDVVNCLSHDEETGKDILTPITITEDMLEDAKKEDPDAEDPDDPDKEDPDDPDKEDTYTYTPPKFWMEPRVQVLCTSPFAYVDVWVLDIGNSAYATSDSKLNEYCGAPAEVTKSGTYIYELPSLEMHTQDAYTKEWQWTARNTQGVLYNYTVAPVDVNIFDQRVDAHDKHDAVAEDARMYPPTTQNSTNTMSKITINGVGKTLNSEQAAYYTYPKYPYVQQSLASIDIKNFGVYSGATDIAAVVEVEDLDKLYNSVECDDLRASVASTAHRCVGRTYRNVIIVNPDVLKNYINIISKNNKNNVGEDTPKVTVDGNGYAPTTKERLEQAVYFFQTSADVKLASVNAIVCPTLGINKAKNETFADVTETGTDSTKGTATVKLPDLTYVPYTIINNINGVTKSGDALDYTITGTTKTPRYDIFGIALDPHEYRTEQYASQYKTNLIPEVLMTYKDSFLDESGNLLNYEDRGALNSLYIAGYNKYSMDLPMYNKATLTYDFDATGFDTVGAATAKGTKASKLTTLADVLYTGTEVSTVADTDKTPSIDFKSYVLDFANPNIGTAWNPDYTADTAYRQVQDWLNTYKGQNAGDTDSFEYTANLAVTYSKEAAYQQTSNAVNGSTTSTISVDGKQMTPIEVTQQYSFDLTNSDGINNTYALLAQYPVTIRNGRLATVSVDGRTYVLYGDGNITTTAQLFESTGFEKLKADHYDVAEAIANMQLPEFASTLTHNGGNQNWKTYEGTSIYTDNTTKTVVDEVGEERSAYDPNYANDAGWYSEDTTVLTIKLYGIDGDIDDHYAFTYKIPLDYGYNSPRNKADLFKSGTAIYAYNELYFRFENTALNADGAVSGTYDITGDEGANNLANEPEIAYVISNATVNDMTR